MYAIREVQTVQNGQVIVQIPADFPTELVEVIVLPAPSSNGDGHQGRIGSVNGASHHPIETTNAPILQNFLTIDTSHFTEEEKAAYERAVEILRKGRKPDEPRVLGLFAGLIKVADDFDAPLPDDIVELFYGSETNDYGMSLPR